MKSDGFIILYIYVNIIFMPMCVTLLLCKVLFMSDECVDEERHRDSVINRFEKLWEFFFE